MNCARRPRRCSRCEGGRSTARRRPARWSGGWTSITCRDWTRGPGRWAGPGGSGWRSALRLQRDDAVPIGGGLAAVLGDVDGQEVLDLVLRRHAVQERERLGPAPFVEGVEGRLVQR